MLEKGKISPNQIMWLLTSFTLGSAILLIPSSVTIYARQDAWLAMLLATLAGLGIIMLYTNLALKFPGQNFMQYSEVILGRNLGKIAGLIVIFVAMYLGSLVVRDFGSFIKATILPQTPMVVINAVIFLLVIMSVRSGLEVFARVNNIIAPCLIILLLFLTVLALPEMDVRKILPLVENGYKPVIRGAQIPIGFPFSETVLFAMIIPYVSGPGEVKKYLLAGGLVGGLLLTLVILRTLMVLGAEATSMLWYPVLEATRMINLFDFLQRIEALIIINWIGFGYAKITICFYAFVLGLAQWLNLRDYKPLVFPSGVLMLALSLIIFDNYVEAIAFINVWASGILFMVILFLILYIVAVIRGLGSGTAKKSDS